MMGLRCWVNMVQFQFFSGATSGAALPPKKLMAPVGDPVALIRALQFWCCARQKRNSLFNLVDRVGAAPTS